MVRFEMTLKARAERAEQIFERLTKAYPEAACSLDHKSPLQLLVSTILSAQCTDERVNQVTKDLFKKYHRAQDYLDVPQEELENDIRTCGFYRNKAKSIRHACQTMVDQFGGKVPGTMEDLLKLGGVGRKTANVVLGTCFDTPGVIVDTHCSRLANRMGFTKASEPAKIEQDLMKVWPEKHWTDFSHLMVFHGRAVCKARAPQCSACPVNDLCPFPTTAKGKAIAK